MSRVLLALFALVLVCVPTAFAVSGVDVSQPVSVSNFQCMKSNGISFAIVRTYQSNGVNDPNGHNTVANAWSAGLAHGMFSFYFYFYFIFFVKKKKNLY